MNRPQTTKRRMALACLMMTPLLVGAGPTPFLGRWALDLPGGAGWLEVRQEAGYLDADILWFGGSVVPVSNVFLDGEHLLVEQILKTEHSPLEADGSPRVLSRIRRIDLELRGDGVLEGNATTPRPDGLGVERMAFAATRIPALPAPPKLDELRFGEPVSLFNGRDLTGWELTSPSSGNGWAARDGVLVNDPDAAGKKHTSNLRTTDTFSDFRLTLDVNVPEGSNSGVYLRGIYEVQIFDSHGRKVDNHHMGAIYSRITPITAAEKPAGTWQDLDVTLRQRHVTVKLNGQTIIDNLPLPGVTGGAMWADESRPGPILLQGDHGPVSYRNVILHPILD